jgi:hypothetical protein
MYGRFHHRVCESLQVVLDEYRQRYIIAPRGRSHELEIGPANAIKFTG